MSKARAVALSTAFWIDCLDGGFFLFCSRWKRDGRINKIESTGIATITHSGMISNMINETAPEKSPSMIEINNKMVMVLSPAVQAR
jgi:hypothetical protein